MTDERDALELLDALRSCLAAYPNDQQAREGIRRLAREIDGAVQRRPIGLETWDNAGPPPPRRWLVKDWLPAGRVTLLAGQGGVGKSRLALQLSAGIASGGGRLNGTDHASESRIWIETPSPDTLKLGEATEPGGGGSLRKLGRRTGRVLEAALGAVRERSALGDAGTVEPPAHSGHGWTRPAMGAQVRRGRHTDTLGETTAAGHELRRRCEEVGARLLIVDPSAAAYGSNENNRALVRAFVSDFDAWARDNNCAVLILSHPPKWAADYSGSTDWEASVRSMWTLRKEGAGQRLRGRGKACQIASPRAGSSPAPKPTTGLRYHRFSWTGTPAAGG